MFKDILFPIFIVAILLIMVALWFLYNQIQGQSTTVATLQSSVTKVISNLDNISTINQLNTTVQALQANPVVSTSTSLSPTVNSTLSKVGAANALTFKLNNTFTLSHYTVTVTPAISNTTTYVDVPLVPISNQNNIVAQRGVSSVTLTPTISANIVNDVRCVVSPDTSFVRVLFTSNGTIDHTLSVTIESS